MVKEISWNSTISLSKTKTASFCCCARFNYLSLHSPAVVLSNALLDEEAGGSLSSRRQSIKPSTRWLVSPGQTDRIGWFLQIETDLTSYYRNFQAYIKNPKIITKSFIHQPLSLIFLEKCGKIERMEESYGITTTWNKWKRYMGSFNNLPNRPSLGRRLERFNWKVQTASQYEGHLLNSADSLARSQNSHSTWNAKLKSLCLCTYENDQDTREARVSRVLCQGNDPIQSVRTSLFILWTWVMEISQEQYAAF